MSWFTRLAEGITTSTKNKKEAPDGVWHKCKQCKEAVTVKNLKDNYFTCPKCNYHERIDSEEYFDIIFDQGSVKMLHENLVSYDFLEFTDLKPYKDRLVESRKKSGHKDSMTFIFVLGPESEGTIIRRAFCRNFK